MSPDQIKAVKKGDVVFFVTNEVIPRVRQFQIVGDGQVRLTLEDAVSRRTESRAAMSGYGLTPEDAIEVYVQSHRNQVEIARKSLAGAERRLSMAVEWARDEVGRR